MARWTYAQDEDHHWCSSSNAGRSGERREIERERETGRLELERGALKIDWTSPRAHSSRFHGQALSIGGRVKGGRAKERKERSFGVHREVVELSQPFGSRGAHNATIVSRTPFPPPRLSPCGPHAAGLATQFRRASLDSDGTFEFFISRYV